jgi:hypothetical protein
MVGIAGSAPAGAASSSGCADGEGAALDALTAGGGETGACAEVTERSQPTSANNAAPKTIAAIIFVPEIRIGFAFS